MRSALPRGAWRTAMMAVALVAGGCAGLTQVPPQPDPPSVAIPETDPLPTRRFVLPEDGDLVGEIQLIRARASDTFVDIARSYGLGFDELVAANPAVDPWLPGAGTSVVLPTRFVLPAAPRRGLVLNVAARRLFWFPPGEPGVVETFPVGIGREGWPTPTGVTTVVSKARDPVWFVPASIRREHAAAGDPLPPRVPPGPDNPLGHRVLGLGLPGYLIHGTNKPAGVGMRVSHGCVRLFPEDIEDLFDAVPVGTPVRIVNQPYLVGWDGADLLLEAHAPLAEDTRAWGRVLPGMARARLVREGRGDVVDAERIVDVVAAGRGIPVSVLAGGASLDEALRGARRVRHAARYAWLENGETALAD